MECVARVNGQGKTTNFENMIGDWVVKCVGSEIKA